VAQLVYFFGAGTGPDRRDRRIWIFGDVGDHLEPVLPPKLLRGIVPGLLIQPEASRIRTNVKFVDIIPEIHAAVDMGFNVLSQAWRFDWSPVKMTLEPVLVVIGIVLVR
jgi:hypothetical protein